MNKPNLGALNLGALPDKKKENLFSALFIGALFIILALVYYVHLADNLWDSLVNFFTTLTLAPVPATGISLPAPLNPSAYTNLYIAAFQFCLALGAVEIAILLIRVKLHSPVPRKAETIENIVFWLGTSYLIIAYLVNMTLRSEWFVFWAGVVLMFGLSLVARAFILMAKR